MNPKGDVDGGFLVAMVAQPATILPIMRTISTRMPLLVLTFDALALLTIGAALLAYLLFDGKA